MVLCNDSKCHQVIRLPFKADYCTHYRMFQRNRIDICNVIMIHRIVHKSFSHLSIQELMQEWRRFEPLDPYAGHVMFTFLMNLAGIITHGVFLSMNLYFEVASDSSSAVAHECNPIVLEVIAHSIHVFIYSKPCARCLCFVYDHVFSGEYRSARPAHTCNITPVFPPGPSPLTRP